MDYVYTSPLISGLITSIVPERTNKNLSKIEENSSESFIGFPGTMDIIKSSINSEINVIIDCANFYRFIANKLRTILSTVMRKQRALFILCSLLGLTIIICVFWRKLSMIPIIISSANHIQCYWSGSSDIVELGQGKWDYEMLIPSRCIFFHETTCSSPNFTPRQACAVESAAKNNRNLNVFLFFFAIGQLSEKSKKFVDILESYDNVYIRRIRLSTYIMGTPIEDWFWANIHRLSEDHDWLRKNFHDYIRMLTLWKYGGVSLNLNSVVLTSLDKLTTFAGMQSDRDMSVGVFGVDTSTNFGRNFADACMEIIKDTNADSYSRYNITKVVTEAVWKLCYQRNGKKCQQFTIYSPKKFYPASLDSRTVRPNETRAEVMLRIGRNSMMIHSWNDYHRDAEGDNAAIYKMAARQHCPKIYKIAEESFSSS